MQFSNSFLCTIFGLNTMVEMCVSSCWLLKITQFRRVGYLIYSPNNLEVSLHRHICFLLTFKKGIYM
jgi:hypothetical protein